MYFIRRCWFLKCSEEIHYVPDLDFFGPWNGTSESRFSGPTPSNAPRNDVASLKTITYRAIKTTGTLIFNSQYPSLVPFFKNHLSSDEYFLLSHGVLDDHCLFVPVRLLEELGTSLSNISQTTTTSYCKAQLIILLPRCSCNAVTVRSYFSIKKLPYRNRYGTAHLKGLSHEMDLAFDDMYF